MRSLSTPLCAVLCLAVLVRLRCAVRVVCAVAGAWWPVVVCSCRVSVSVSLSGRVVCFPVVGVVCCGALPLCVVFCGPVLSRGAVLLCSAVILRCCLCLLCPPVACCAALCCAVLCCWLSVLLSCRWWCLRAVVLFPSCCAFPVSTALCVAGPRCAGCGALLPCVESCGAVLPLVLWFRALPSFCGADCACFAHLWPVVWLCAVLCCAVGSLCCCLPGGGVCVLWCPFPPCRHAKVNRWIITLCYPAPVSASVVHVVEEYGLFIRRCRLVCRRLR